jgi:rare lipoprotein A
MERGLFMSLVDTLPMQIRSRIATRLALLLGLIALHVYDGSGNTEQIFASQTGDATFYASSLEGEQTASGSTLDNRKALAAHRTYPFGTVARVTNLKNGKSVTVVVVDRGPYGKNRKEGAIIDLSRSAAEKLGMIRDGQVPVRVDVLKWGQNGPAGSSAVKHAETGRKNTN